MASRGHFESRSQRLCLPGAVGVTEEREASGPALGFLVQVTGRPEGPFSVPARWEQILLSV